MIALQRRLMPAVFGLALGLGLSAVAYGVRLAIEAERERAPVVVTMSGRLVAADNDAVRVSMWGEKHLDCTYVGMQGFFGSASSGKLRDAMIRRIDMAEVGATKPPGAHYDIGVWELRPRNGATRALVYVQHTCGSRLITTKIADVEVAP